jgi:hypothetical protein
MILLRCFIYQTSKAESMVVDMFRSHSILRQTARCQ